jgi:hypothetical protein
MGHDNLFTGFHIAQATRHGERHISGHPTCMPWPWGQRQLPSGGLAAQPDAGAGRPGGWGQGDLAS